MIRRFVTALARSVTGLHEAAYILAAFALCSQVLALVRDRLLAHVFGASEALDIYYAAFRVPDFLFVSLASMVSLFVLIPLLTDRLGNGKGGARQLLASVTTVFFTMMVVVSVALFFAIPYLSLKLYPGFTDVETQTQLVLLTRILLLSPILLGLSNILASVTQTFRKFTVYALSPVVYNVGIIVGIFAFYPVWGLPGLAYGVIFGALLHVGIQVPTVTRLGLLPRLTWHINFHEVYRVITLSLPRTLALALNHGALLALVALASLLPEGSISIFNFALNLQAAPLSVIGVSYSVAAFPMLARLFAQGETSTFIEHIVSAIRHVLFWSFPAIVLFIVLRAQIVRTILGSGAFDWDATRLTAAALALFVISLAAHALMLLFVRGYYATGRTWRPFAINALASGLIILTAYGGVAFFQAVPTARYFIEALFRVTGIPGTVILMLPLAYSVGVLVNALVFWVLFRHDFGELLPRSLYRTLWQSFSAAIIGGGAAYVALQFFARVFDLETLPGIFLQGLCAGLIGIGVMVAVLAATRNRELQEMWQALHSKFWQRTPVLPETEEL